MSNCHRVCIYIYVRNGGGILFAETLLSNDHPFGGTTLLFQAVGETHGQQTYIINFFIFFNIREAEEIKSRERNKRFFTPCLTRSDSLNT
jgi:hypothetical protein